MSGWRRATACNFGECIEIGRGPDHTVLVRDSKHPEQQPLRFSRAEWAAFLAGVKNGEFDHLS